MIGDIDLNKLAKKIAEKEGLKEQVNIAQIKEVLRVTLEELSQEAHWKVLKLLDKYLLKEVLKLSGK